MKRSGPDPDAGEGVQPLSAVSPDASAGPRHFIAVNAHRFHDAGDILACCQSVSRAVAALDDATRAATTAILFRHDHTPLPAGMATRIADLGLSVRPGPEAPNGACLNLQIEAALAEGHDFFYRVDADDLVFEDRFARQAALFASDTADILGGGLVYESPGLRHAVLPSARPPVSAYLFNRYALHPTLAFRLSAFARSGLRYATTRLEDKALMARADAAGLRFRNDPHLYGTYRLNPLARDTPAAAALNLKLNLAFVAQRHAWHLVPLAGTIWLSSRVLPSQTLRRLRAALFRPQTVSLPAEPPVRLAPNAAREPAPQSSDQQPLVMVQKQE